MSVRQHMPTSSFSALVICILKHTYQWGLDQTFRVCVWLVQPSNSEIYDWEIWFYPLPATTVSLSSLRAGRWEFLKITLSSLGEGRKTCICCGAWRKRHHPVCSHSSPLWLGALMCPFDVPALRQLERIIKSSLNHPGWSWGCSTIAYAGLHSPNVNTCTEVELPECIWNFQGSANPGCVYGALIFRISFGQDSMIRKFAIQDGSHY